MGMLKNKKVRQLLVWILSYNLVFLSIPIVPLGIHIPFFSISYAYGCEATSTTDSNQAEKSYDESINLDVSINSEDTPDSTSTDFLEEDPLDPVEAPETRAIEAARDQLIEDLWISSTRQQNKIEQTSVLRTASGLYTVSLTLSKNTYQYRVTSNDDGTMSAAATKDSKALINTIQYLREFNYGNSIYAQTLDATVALSNEYDPVRNKYTIGLYEARGSFAKVNGHNFEVSGSDLDQPRLLSTQYVMEGRAITVHFDPAENGNVNPYAVEKALENLIPDQLAEGNHTFDVENYKSVNETFYETVINYEFDLSNSDAIFGFGVAQRDAGYSATLHFAPADYRIGRAMQSLAEMLYLPMEERPDIQVLSTNGPTVDLKLYHNTFTLNLHSATLDPLSQRGLINVLNDLQRRDDAYGGFSGRPLLRELKLIEQIESIENDADSLIRVQQLTSISKDKITYDYIVSGSGMIRRIAAAKLYMGYVVMLVRSDDLRSTDIRAVKAAVAHLIRDLAARNAPIPSELFLIPGSYQQSSLTCPYFCHQAYNFQLLVDRQVYEFDVSHVDWQYRIDSFREAVSQVLEAAIQAAKQNLASQYGLDSLERQNITVEAIEPLTEMEMRIVLGFHNIHYEFLPTLIEHGNPADADHWEAGPADATQAVINAVNHFRNWIASLPNADYVVPFVSLHLVGDEMLPHDSYAVNLREILPATDIVYAYRFPTDRPMEIPEMYVHYDNMAVKVQTDFSTNVSADPYAIARSVASLIEAEILLPLDGQQNHTLWLQNYWARPFPATHAGVEAGMDYEFDLVSRENDSIYGFSVRREWRSYFEPVLHFVHANDAFGWAIIEVNKQLDRRMAERMSGLNAVEFKEGSGIDVQVGLFNIDFFITVIERNAFYWEITPDKKTKALFPALRHLIHRSQRVRFATAGSDDGGGDSPLDKIYLHARERIGDLFRIELKETQTSDILYHFDVSALYPSTILDRSKISIQYREKTVTIRLDTIPVVGARGLDANPYALELAVRWIIDQHLNAGGPFDEQLGLSFYEAGNLSYFPALHQEINVTLDSGENFFVFDIARNDAGYNLQSFPLSFENSHYQDAMDAIRDYFLNRFDGITEEDIEKISFERVPGNRYRAVVRMFLNTFIFDVPIPGASIRPIPADHARILALQDFAARNIVPLPSIRTEEASLLEDSSYAVTLASGTTTYHYQIINNRAKFTAVTFEYDTGAPQPVHVRINLDPGAVLFPDFMVLEKTGEKWIQLYAPAPGLYDFDLRHYRHQTDPGFPVISGTYSFDLISDDFFYGFYVSRVDGTFETVSIAFLHANNKVGWALVTLAELLNRDIRGREDDINTQFIRQSIDRVEIPLFEYFYRFTVTGEDRILDVQPDPETMAVINGVNYFQQRSPQLGGPLELSQIRVWGVGTEEDGLYKIGYVELRPEGRQIKYKISVRHETGAPAAVLSATIIFYSGQGPEIYIKYGTFHGVNAHALEAAAVDILEQNSLPEGAEGLSLFLDEYFHSVLLSDSATGSLTQEISPIVLDSGIKVYRYSVSREGAVYTVTSSSVEDSPGLIAAENAVADLAQRLGIPSGDITVHNITRMSEINYHVYLGVGQLRFTYLGDTAHLQAAPSVPTASLIHALNDLQDFYRRDSIIMPWNNFTLSIASSNLQSLTVGVSIYEETGEGKNHIYQYEDDLARGILIAKGASILRGGHSVEIDYNHRFLDINIYALGAAVEYLIQEGLTLGADAVLTQYQAGPMTDRPGAGSVFQQFSLTLQSGSAIHTLRVTRTGSAYEAFPPASSSDEVLAVASDTSLKSSNLPLLSSPKVYSRLSQTVDYFTRYRLSQPILRRTMETAVAKPTFESATVPISFSSITINEDSKQSQEPFLARPVFFDTRLMSEKKEAPRKVRSLARNSLLWALQIDLQRLMLR